MDPKQYSVDFIKKKLSDLRVGMHHSNVARFWINQLRDAIDAGKATWKFFETCEEELVVLLRKAEKKPWEFPPRH